jgi:SAM-dependent methyltransferase
VSQQRTVPAAGQRAPSDVVCGFHAIEHVADPLGFARDLAMCTRPGGRLCIVVPSRVSAITEIPNFVLNAPPHHLSWWNEDALRGLADRLDLLTEAIEAVPFSFDTIIYWMGRCCKRSPPRRTALRSPRLPGDQQQRRGLRGGWDTEHRIAGAAEQPAPSECATPDPMGSEVSLPGQFRRATTSSAMG